MPTTYAGKLADPAWRHDRAVKAGRASVKARTTPEGLVATLREIVDRTRAEQGLPPHITDPLTLSTVADILRLPSTPDDRGAA
jgi:hypothetical protein